MPYRVILRGLPLALLLLWLLPLWAAEPIQSPNDPRAYQSLTLDNRLQVLLVSDPETDKAAAALALEVGSIDDPPDHLGLAHFLEHMLFLGTEKYPEPGEYKDFLAAHGGSHNAYTAYEHTNYFFEVDADHLEPALDRFAQFFIAPLFTPRYVDNERQVVHSEYQSKLGSDGWRIRSAQQQALNPEHPASRFSVGSRETLADRPEAPIRETLIRFYRTHYSANLMKLVVLGKEPLPVLRRWVEARFAAVADHDAAPRLVDVPMFRDDQLPARLAVQSLEDERNLTLTFPLPPQRDAYRSKPAGYVAHLLGHEGEGSLLARLKQLGWASGLWAGLSADNRSEASFSVSIRLTEAGLEQADAIIERVFQARQLIERDGIEAWRYAEQRRLAEIDFRFQERGSAGAHARRLAANLLQYPVREVLRGPYLMEDFDPQAIRDLLARLTPDNLLVTLSAPVLDTDAVDPWFQVPYRLEPVATETLNAWRDPEPEPQLALPEPNPYIPERLVLRDLPPQPSAEPRLIRRRPGLALWHQQAVDFRVPRAEYYFSVRSPRANDSAAHAVLTELYVRSVEEQLSDELYPAALAGLNARLYRHMRGFTVRLSGYDEKQGLLLERIVATLREPAFEPERFARLVETLAAELRNAAQAPPYRQALHEIPDLLLDPSWTDAQRLEVLEDLDVADLRAFVPQLLARLELVVLAYGNLGTERAEAMTRTLESGLLAAAEPTSVPRGGLLQLRGHAPLLRRL
ncbi:MAG: insulinase family protein [Candidatus Competibacterales bacterium]|nr:insulinase family protein [Candidatus Competibacterales bacterium]